MDKLGKPIKNLFRDVEPPRAVLGNTSYLGNGYWKGNDLSQNVALQNVNSLQVGAGDTGIKMDQGKQWFGGNKFEDARIRIDAQGNMVFRDSSGYDRILIGESN